MFRIKEIKTNTLGDKSKNARRPMKMAKKKQIWFAKNFPLIITPKKLSLVFSIIVIALVFGYFWHQLNYLLNPPSIKIVQPASDITTQEEVIEISGQTESDVYLTINGREVYVDSSGYFRSAINLELGLNILKIEAKDRFGKTNTIIRRVMVIK